MKKAASAAIVGAEKPARSGQFGGYSAAMNETLFGFDPIFLGWLVAAVILAAIGGRDGGQGGGGK